MRRLAIAYLAVALAMLVPDALWLSLAVPALYQPALGDLLAPQPDFAAAAVFYLLYVAGIVVLAVRPAFATGSLTQAVLLGGFLGLVAYGTYDLTNLAVLRDWPLSLTVVDMIWGTLLTAFAATAGFLAARRFGGA